MRPPVFTLSTGRCGTKTLSRILGLSTEVCSWHEPRPRLNQYLGTVYQNRYGGDVELHDILRNRFFGGRLYITNDGRRVEDGLVYSETNSWLTFWPFYLLRLFPDARFIHLIRRREDVAASAIKRARYIRGNDTIVSPDIADWASRPSLERARWVWAMTNGYIREFLAREIPRQRRMLVESERLFEDVETSAHIFDFVGVPREPRAAVEEILAMKLNASASKKG